jgi:hypothetical protein
LYRIIADICTMMTRALATRGDNEKKNNPRCMAVEISTG